MLATCARRSEAADTATMAMTAARLYIAMTSPSAEPADSAG